MNEQFSPNTYRITQFPEQEIGIKILFSPQIIHFDMQFDIDNIYLRIYLVHGVI